MSSTRKTPEHIVPAYNLREDAEAAEAAQSTAAAEAAQPQAAEVAQAAQPAQAAEGRMVCREIPGGRKARGDRLRSARRCYSLRDHRLIVAGRASGAALMRLDARANMNRSPNAARASTACGKIALNSGLQA